jgi:hypothetical protein
MNHRGLEFTTTKLDHGDEIVGGTKAAGDVFSSGWQASQPSLTLRRERLTVTVPIHWSYLPGFSFGHHAKNSPWFEHHLDLPLFDGACVYRIDHVRLSVQ